jgi:hypothetical protein
LHSLWPSWNLLGEIIRHHFTRMRTRIGLLFQRQPGRGGRRRSGVLILGNRKAYIWPTLREVNLTDAAPCYVSDSMAS